jgi:RHS repeat-associated protein
MGETTAVTISDNIITSSGSDLSIGSKNISNLNIYKNTFTASSDNQYGECLGISTNSVMNSVNINTNVFFFTNNGDGIVIYNSGNNVSSDIFVNFNSFYVTYFNSPRPSTGISAENVFVNAQYNYWGSCYAPKNISEYKGINNGYCYVTDNVDYSNWLGQDFAKQFHYGQDGGYSPLGIYSQTFSDLKVDAPGLDVDFSRTYNSLSDKSGSFGRGWSFGFEGHCKDYKYTYFKADGTTGTITMPNMKGVTLPDGSVLTFTLKSGIWTASNSQNTFVENTDGGYTLTTKDGHVYIFNSNCYLVSVADKNGNRIAMNVDASGKVQYVTDGAGRVYTISYNADGTVSQIMDPTGRNVTYQYANGQLAGVTDALNHTIYQYSYDASGYLTQIRNAASNLDQAITYDHTSTDNKDKITSLTDKQGNTISYVYDNTNKSVTKTDSIGRQTIEWFNDAYQIIKTQDEEGKIATKTYADYSGNLSTSTDRNGNTTGYQIDANGNTTQLTNPDQSTKSYTYDAQNNRTSETDESGNRVFYVYDSSNNLVLKAQPLNGIDVYTEGCDTTSFAITSYVYYTDAESSQHGYLAKRLLKQITDPNGNATTYTYDANGYPQTVSDPSGNVTHYTYNSVGWLLSQTTPKGYTTTYDYDKTGKLLRTTDAGSGILRNVYDVVGRIIQQISPNQYNPADDGLNLATPNDTYANANVGDRFAYDTHSNVISKTDPENNTTTYTYDLYSNILSSTQPNGGINSIAYDIMNRKADVYFKDNAQAEQKHLQSFVYTILADGKTQTTTNQFLNATDTASTVSTSDYAGRTISQQNPDGTTNSVLYNTNGTVNCKTAVNGAKEYYKYDGLNRLTEQWTEIDTNLYAYISFAYDKAGNQIQQKSGIDAVALWSVPTVFITTSSTYYPNGKQQSITDNEGRKNFNYYDADGNLVKTEKYTSPTEFTTTESSYNYLEKPVTVSSHVRTGDIAGNDFADNSDTVLTTHYTYDKNGNALTVTTPNAVTTTYTYDRLNRQTQVSSTSTDENGQPVTITSSVTYTWDGKVQTSTDANGNVSSNVYDTRGLLTKTIDACGNTTSKYYDNAGRLVAVVSPLNYDPLKTLDQMSRTEYAYDLMGRVKTVTQTYYDNQTSQWVTFVEKAYQYDSLGNVTKELGAIGYASGTGTTVDDRINTGDGILYFYNLGGKLTLKLTSMIEPTQYTYDALGRVTSKSNERGVKTGYTYDGAGKLLTEKVYIGALSEEQTVRSYTYDLLGQVLSQTDGNGNTTTYTYNVLGKVRQTTSPGDSTVSALTSYCQYNTSGNISDMWTSAGKKETDTYDNQGHILSKTQSAVDGSSPITVSFRYDKNGNLRYSTDGNGNVTSATYDALNRVLTQTKGSATDGYQTTTVAYDANGNKVTSTDWRGNTSTNIYDAMNRLIEQKDAYGHTVEKYTYNNNSLQVTATDALGNVTAFAYDREDRLIQTTDPVGHITSQVYNNLGLVDSKTDGNGNTTSYIYDQRSRLQAVVNAANEATFYTYDANGKVLTLTDGLGHVTTYEYNCRNQLIKTISDGGRTGTSGNYTYDLSKVQSYTYTADGQAATKTDRNGNTTTYLYDIHGNLLSQTVEAAAGSTTGSTTVSYTYDNNGNTLTMTDTTGTTTRVYDSFNRTTSKTVPDMGTSTYAYDITADTDAGCTAQTTTDPKGNVTQKIYDRVGRISQVIADGLTTVYHYNDNGSVQSVVYSDGSREDYTYTSDNHLDTLTNTKADATVIDTYSYTYDAAHNMLTKVDARGTTAYTYDSLNRLLTVTEPSGKITGYTYDASGNRLTETDTLGTDVTVITYAYDSQNRLNGTVTTLAESTVVTGDEGTAAITTTGAATITSTVAYTYDNNGNQLSKTTTDYVDGVAQTEVVDQANTYDLFNQLIATVTSAGVIVINTYNGDGLRVGKSVNGSLTRYLYEYQKVVLEENASGDQTGRNVYGINLLTRQAKDDTDTPAYTLTYMYNGHADVTALLDTAGNVVATYYYDAFGNILAQTGTVNNSILYTGYQYDKETGLYYLNARMYDPITARFMQEDTYTGEYSDPLSLNLYAYCNNDPLMYSDPTGHSTLDDYEYQKNVEKRRNTLSSTLDNYSYQNTTKKTSSRQSNSLDNYYYNQDMTDAHLLQQTREQQKAPQTITSTAKSTDVGQIIGNVAKAESSKYDYNLEPVFGLYNSIYDAQFAAFEKATGSNSSTLGYGQFKNIYKFGVGFAEGSANVILDTASTLSKLQDTTYQISNAINTSYQIAAVLNNSDQMSAIANAINNPQATLNSIGNGISTSFQQTVSDPYKFGNASAQVVGFVAPFFIGAGELGAASKAGKAEELLSVATKTEVGIMEGSRAAEAGAEVTEGLNSLSEANSTVLRQNLIDAGIEVPDYANAAHHIVAGNSPKAAEARAILQKYGIDINDAENGVFLPTVKDAAESAYHPSLHTNSYYAEVNNLLSDVSSKSEAIDILKYISEELTNRTFLR